MYERKRRAIDLAGRRVELIERQEAGFMEMPDGRTNYRAPAKFFEPSGKQLIPEGHGFFRTPFGVRYKLID